MVNERTALRLEILEKIGAPLLLVADRARPDDDKQTAETVAALLARSVQTGIALGGSLNLQPQDDAERVALAALAARIVAGRFAMAGKVPSDADLAQMGAVVDAVLAFADNYAAGAEARTRLQILEGDARAAALPDETQMALQYVEAMVPVAQVVAAYSFGRPEKKLIQEIARRLDGDAEDLFRSVASAGLPSGGALRRGVMGCLRIVAGLYAGVHMAETAQLAMLDEQVRSRLAGPDGQVAMDAVWEAYDRCVVMITVLAGQDEAPAVKVPPVQAPSVQAPAQAAPAAPITVQQATEEAIAAMSRPVPVDPAPAANPMSFFTKKGGDTAQGGEGA